MLYQDSSEMIINNVTGIKGSIMPKHPPQNPIKAGSYIENTSYQECFFQNSDGLVLHYRNYSAPHENAEIMLCIPGLTRNARDFQEVADQFSPHFHVICVDLRGRGKSDYDPDPARYTPAIYCTDMFELMAHLSVDKVHICGTSLGGIVAMMMQAVRPGCLKTAIINDIGSEINAAGLNRIKKYIGASRHHSSWESASKALQKSAQNIYPDFNAHDWEKFANKLFIKKQGQIELDYDPALVDMVKSSDTSAATDLWPLFSLMKDIPLMVIRGEISDLLRPDTLVKMTEFHPDLMAITVPNVGHAPLLIEPLIKDAFNQWIKRFAVWDNK